MKQGLHPQDDAVTGQLALVDYRLAKDAIKRAEHARSFPRNTCAASRHALLMARGLVNPDRGYPMLHEEPIHCAHSIASTVASLWEARARIAELERLLKLSSKVSRKFAEQVHPKSTEK